MVRVGAALLVVVFCGSAFADPSKNVVTPTKRTTVQVKQKRKTCYTWVTGYGMPIPCEQMRGAIVTTSRSLTIIGNRGNYPE